jgi:hypothetical protein
MPQSEGVERSRCTFEQLKSRAGKVKVMGHMTHSANLIKPDLSPACTTRWKLFSANDNDLMVVAVVKMNHVVNSTCMRPLSYSTFRKITISMLIHWCPFARSRRFCFSRETRRRSGRVVGRWPLTLMCSNGPLLVTIDDKITLVTGWCQLAVRVVQALPVSTKPRRSTNRGDW